MKQWLRYATSLMLCLCMLLPTANLLALAAQHTQVTNLPTLYITLDGGAPIGTITKTTQLPATFSMRAEGFEDITDAPITIKGRGNSTWQLPKKPYQIKFSVKTDLLGMGASKKWILLANYWDKTLMRNAVTYELANKMNNIFSVEFHHVDVYMNGQYQGNYLLCEKIEFGGQRIDEDTAAGAVLMELEQQYRHAADGCDACVITDDGVHVLIKEPEQDENYTVEQMEATKSATLSRLNTIEQAIADGYDSYSQVIDVPSFIDWYIQNELAKNYDAAFVTSSYCYLDSLGVLHMGPVWDVDVCFGNQDVTYPDTNDNGLNYYNYRSDKGAWYLGLFQDETFVKMLKARWAEIKRLGYLDQMVNRIDSLAVELCDSQFMETQRWPDAMMVTHVRDQGKGTGGTPYFTYDEEVEYFKDWLIRRIDWLDSQWNDEYHPWQLYSPVETLTGEDIAPANVTVSNGQWSWKYIRYPSPINRRVATSQEFFQYDIESGKYIISAKYKHTVSNATDGMLMKLYGIAEDGERYLLYTTAATHVSYATAPKDADGFATLSIGFNTAKYPYMEHFYAQIEAYNGTMAIKEVTLHQNTVSFLRGDVNQDGAVTAADALLVLQSVVGKVQLNEQQKQAACCSKDNEVNAADALLILQFVVGKIKVFPADA